MSRTSPYLFVGVTEMLFQIFYNNIFFKICVEKVTIREFAIRDFIFFFCIRYTLIIYMV